MLANRPQCINTFRPGKNGHYVANSIFKCIFFNENFWILIQISLYKFVLKSLIDNIASEVQVMAWHPTGKKPLPETVIT